MWSRRETLLDEEDNAYDLLSLPDLVCAKKTQREKDWPMLRRLMEAHYFQHRTSPTAAQLEFWFREMRTSELLTDLAIVYPQVCKRMVPVRPLLQTALAGDIDGVRHQLNTEMLVESAVDRQYWAPLKKELRLHGGSTASRTDG